MTVKKPGVLIVADEKLTGRLKRSVEDQYQVNVIETPTKVDLFCKRAAQIAADAVIIDCDLLDFDWVSATYRISELEPKPSTIVLSRNFDKAALLSAFREGADACIPKRDLRDEIIPALQAAATGRIYYRQEDADTIRDHLRYLELGPTRNVADVQNGISRLTVREKEIFPLLADGKPIKDVGKTLGISPKTVETHKYHIMEKLHLKRMADFTKLAMIKDLLPL